MNRKNTLTTNIWLPFGYADDGDGCTAEWLCRFGVAAFWNKGKRAAKAQPNLYYAVNFSSVKLKTMYIHFCISLII